MNITQKLFKAGYLLIVALFALSAFVLIAFAGAELWQALKPGDGAFTSKRFNFVLECISLLTIAVASLELGQTILEEEVIRTAQMSAPTRARRFLSRFLLVVVVALSIESLVAVFQFAHDDPAKLKDAAMITFGAAALLAAWGIFIKLNKSAEELEPDALAEAKGEDHKV